MINICILYFYDVYKLYGYMINYSWSCFVHIDS